MAPKVIALGNPDPPKYFGTGLWPVRAGFLSLFSELPAGDINCHLPFSPMKLWSGGLCDPPWVSCTIASTIKTFGSYH